MFPTLEIENCYLVSKTGTVHIGMDVRKVSNRVVRTKTLEMHSRTPPPAPIPTHPHLHTHTLSLSLSLCSPSSSLEVCTEKLNRISGFVLSLERTKNKHFFECRIHPTAIWSDLETLNNKERLIRKERPITRRRVHAIVRHARHYNQLVLIP